MTKTYLFLRFPNFRKKALTLSYDDNTRHDIRLVSIMKKYGIKGTFNLNSGGLTGSEWAMSEQEVIDLFKDGDNEIAVHGVKHYSLAEMEKSVAVKEVLDDRQNLERIFQRVVRGMAYANGSVDDETVETLKACGIHYARTTLSTGDFLIPTDWLKMPATCHHKAPNLMELAEKFLSDETGSYYWNKLNAPRLFYLWGHAFEFANDNNWEVIEKFCEYVGGREDVWYATNGEIYDYVQAYNRLEFSVSQDFVYNPSAIDVYIDYFGKKVVVPAGKTVEIK